MSTRMSELELHARTVPDKSGSGAQQTTACATGMAAAPWSGKFEHLTTSVQPVVAGSDFKVQIWTMS